jgi:uncharacterized protein (TIGR00725 family)
MIKISVFSSWLPEMEPEHKVLAENIGRYLAECGVHVITGGCVGLPSVVVEAAYKGGAVTTGYFPDMNEYSLLSGKEKRNSDTATHYTNKRFYNGFTYRSLRMIEDADGAIVFNGRLGTLSEFTMAVEEDLKMAVTLDSGGITDEIQRIAEAVNRQFPESHVIFERDYKIAIDALIRNIKNFSGKK